MATSTSAASKR